MRDDEESDWWVRLLDDMAQTENPLTPTEARVLACVSRGMLASQTAEVLGVTVTSVAQHVKMARRKLQAKTTTHAACEAIRLGLIP